MEEPSLEKQRALHELCYADDAQHSFSTKTDPVLSQALPALEKLHKTWSAIAKKQKYECYHDAINAGLNKISTYYNKASGIDAYTVYMNLDPSLKTLHFKKAWFNDLELPARELMLKIVEVPERHVTRTSSDGSLAPNADKPWLREFNRYIDRDDQLGPMGRVSSHGGGFIPNSSRRGLHLPETIWPSWPHLFRVSACFHKPASPSRNVITASRPNIIEALQILKSVINTGLIFCEHDATVDWEFENELEEDDNDPAWVDVDADGSDREDDDSMVIDD
ncbi:hypothetical protein DFP72DRAFT_1071999 [Ephemerocybe angulata]|uniref:Uncharacterized protein n=1 Tax=Ephemerocybe angulata TaxID=980116 RepID=A0A8H6M2I6_9AGAR|nr:hypothetical protein DFP72DRAFT_1071999 [Tulosesus angulatus]